MMYCNILRKKDLKPEKKQCFKTKYKKVVYRTMEILKRNNITFEQFYKLKGLKQINF